MPTDKKELSSVETQKDTVLQCQRVLNTDSTSGIHEGQISLTHGFTPYTPVGTTLPPAYEAWEELSKNLHRYISEGSEREHINDLPLLDASDATQLPNECLAHALTILGNFAHAYYYNQRLGSNQESDPLPKNLLLPWEQLVKRVGRTLPIDATEHVRAFRNHYDVMLNNWRLRHADRVVDGTHNAEITLDDIEMLSPVFGSSAEFNFNMTIMIMELWFAPTLQHMLNAIKAVAEKDEDALLLALQNITACIETVTSGLDYINQNPHSEHYVDPAVWTKTVANFDRQIPDGGAGLSGNSAPLFHTLDTFIERHDYDTPLGQSLLAKLKIQPEHIRDFLSAMRGDLDQYSIKRFVEQSQNSRLKHQYALMLASYLGDKGLMDVHMVKVYGFMGINFRMGRLQTNGGHEGTATIETNPQRHIHDDFIIADAERLAGYMPRQQYATKVSTHTYPNKTTDIVLDVSDTAFQFQPGDHCAIQPENSNDEIQAAEHNYQLSLTVSLKLNPTWIRFFQHHYGCQVEEMTMGELLKHADLDYMRSVQVKGAPVTIAALKPLAPRYYSVSPVPHFPQRLSLTVSEHTYSVGQTQRHGISSSYLMNKDNKVIAIDRIPARNFHLPLKKETPILMFAAGTGISPFIGFIDERSQYSDKRKNLLFLSTPDRDSFYHEEKLAQAVRDDKLDLSVIFSREKSFDSVKITPHGFEPTQQYQGKHVDQLIKARAQEIADLIVKEHAEIYICGNTGFAESVQTAVAEALKAHSDLPDANAYVDTMIADYRLHRDVYSATNYARQYREVFASEVATHNTLGDCWGIINGGVYNLTQFIHRHPGGQKIVMVNAGIDMSGDYNYIGHSSKAEIESLLEQYKVGVIAKPELHEEKVKELYGKSKLFMEALTEMENTLRNNTVNPDETAEPYLWREVYSVFVDGSLAGYRKPGEGNAGSLNYVLGTIFKDLAHSLNAPLAPINEIYVRLMTQASGLASALRGYSIGHLSDAELKKIRDYFDIVLQETFKFIGVMRANSLELLKEIEEHGDNYNNELLTSKVEAMTRSMTSYSGIIEHINKWISKSAVQPGQSVPSLAGSICPFASKLSKPMEPSSGCPFARGPQSTAQTMAKVGFLADRTSSATMVREEASQQSMRA